MRILVPIDTSDASLQAVRHAMKLAWGRNDVDIHLLNVCSPLPRAISGFIDRGEIRRFHEERGAPSLWEAQRLLERSCLPYSCAMSVGKPAESIVEYASEHRCGQIVMGARPLGALSEALFGSLPMRVVSASDLPVTLVK